MNFLIFRDFFGFFRIYFRFLNVENNLKTGKMGLFLRGTHVDATWHARPRGSATRAHAAPTQHDVTCAYLYIS